MSVCVGGEEQDSSDIQWIKVGSLFAVTIKRGERTGRRLSWLCCSTWLLSTRIVLNCYARRTQLMPKGSDGLVASLCL